MGNPDKTVKNCYFTSFSSGNIVSTSSGEAASMHF